MNRLTWIVLTNSQQGFFLPDSSEAGAMSLPVFLLGLGELNISSSEERN